MNANFGIRNLKKFVNAMERASKTTDKAAKTAVKVEGFRLLKKLRSEMRDGAPGGLSFQALSVIAAYSSLPYGRKPLRKLASATRYAVDGKNDEMRFRFGFIASKSSKAWVRIATQSQEGMETKVTPHRRRYLARWGAWLLPKAAVATGDARFFFLRRTTKVMHNPPRPIIVPFWEAHWEEAGKNIQANFYRKLRGERI